MQGIVGVVPVVALKIFSDRNKKIITFVYLKVIKSNARFREKLYFYTLLEALCRSPNY